MKLLRGARQFGEESDIYRRTTKLARRKLAGLTRCAPVHSILLISEEVGSLELQSLALYKLSTLGCARWMKIPNLRAADTLRLHCGYYALTNWTRQLCEYNMKHCKIWDDESKRIAVSHMQHALIAKFAMTETRELCDVISVCEHMSKRLESIRCQGCRAETETKIEEVRTSVRASLITIFDLA